MNINVPKTELNKLKFHSATEQIWANQGFIVKYTVLVMAHVSTKRAQICTGVSSHNLAEKSLLRTQNMINSYSWKTGPDKEVGIITARLYLLSQLSLRANLLYCLQLNADVMDHFNVKWETLKYVTMTWTRFSEPARMSTKPNHCFNENRGSATWFTPLLF